jgi:hypothetical protein
MVELCCQNLDELEYCCLVGMRSAEENLSRRHESSAGNRRQMQHTLEALRPERLGSRGVFDLLNTHHSGLGRNPEPALETVAQARRAGSLGAVPIIRCRLAPVNASQTTSEGVAESLADELESLLQVNTGGTNRGYEV